ncbi:MULTISPECIES: DUF2325 domain-containing protein [Paenibacillus]|uniref:DUF2325 domain-containing protein n=2 Tax=Paenibacillus TaxID=44249 RepID=A0A7Y6EUR2_9BACL|nr:MULTISPECIES: DUF2325 domain-containing protein [Paenibacillus]KGP81380.1 hypothetical protein P363_0128230 [Paenibacillus sp. MAEPY1]KGP82016.1 hypothetical protein P364_0114485 [Paenibacillus sp. MAEPY2]MDN4603937.1 DUF2325 domain-containing protein [Paenibacillus vandeheii]NUU74635.1 DUF2325 domain-containing protein [Paenibacillus xylanilyticus]
MKLAIIGGTQTETFKQIGKKYGLDVNHHHGLCKRKVEKQLEPLIRKSDVIIILKGALQHVSMWKAKDLAKEYNKLLGFHDGRGATGAIEEALCLLGTVRGNQ